MDKSKEREQLKKIRETLRQAHNGEFDNRGINMEDPNKSDQQVRPAEILMYPHPILSAVAEEVTDFNEAALIAALMEVTLAGHGNGIGLAAPQIGISKRIILVKMRVKGGDIQSLVMCNPKVTVLEGSEKKTGWAEGCLSLPGFADTVYREDLVLIEYTDLMGEPRSIDRPQGLFRVVILHEIDHLNGKVFIEDESVTEVRRKKVTKELLKKYHKS